MIDDSEYEDPDYVTDFELLERLQNDPEFQKKYHQQVLYDIIKNNNGWISLSDMNAEGFVAVEQGKMKESNHRTFRPTDDYMIELEISLL